MGFAASGWAFLCRFHLHILKPTFQHLRRSKGWGSVFGKPIVDLENFPLRGEAESVRWSCQAMRRKSPLRCLSRVLMFPMIRLQRWDSRNSRGDASQGWREGAVSPAVSHDGRCGNVADKVGQKQQYYGVSVQ